MVEITAQFKRARGFSPKVLLVTPTRAEAFDEQEFLRFQAKLVTNAIFGRDKMVVFSGQPMKKDWDMLRGESRKSQKEELMRMASDNAHRVDTQLTSTDLHAPGSEKKPRR
ncbi:hypothetical protein VD0004_g1497 [Verticillium dahliae]|uniref:Uncharacterized protein n=1 Tax=Verticillium dahliae TaxID=27337 RepID=A0A444S879_VERDA|nr:hypothetical protein VD0004_g1497 [Verticillium dahliae]PNH75771.1 hypothetical protein VD0001_g1745 [Verticillium dahliae]RXG49607.1 hypothetical protein VDGE_20288 [Verticillium dahliae]